MHMNIIIIIFFKSILVKGAGYINVLSYKKHNSFDGAGYAGFM